MAHMTERQAKRTDIHPNDQVGSSSMAGTG